MSHTVAAAARKTRTGPERRSPTASGVPRQNWLALASLVTLAGVEAAGVYEYGGVMTMEWSLCLLVLAAMSLVWWIAASPEMSAPSLPRLIGWTAGLLPCYAVFQALPLPVFVVRALSPSRGALLEALKPLGSGAEFASLSIVPSDTLRHAFEIAGCLACFLLVREVGWRLRRWPWLLAAPLLAIAVVEAIAGLLQFGVGTDDGHISGTFMNRNHFAGFLEMTLPFAVGLSVSGLREFWSGIRSSAVYVRTCSGVIAAAVIFVGILCSLSRGGMLGSLLAMITMAIAGAGAMKGSGKRRTAVLCAAVVLLAGAVLAFTPDQLVDRLGSNDNSELFRKLLWQRTLHLIAAYPVFGCGLGGYESAFLRYQDFAVRYYADFAHNDYLQLLAEAGIVGFLVGVTFFLLILRHAFRCARRAERRDARLVALACAGALVAMAFHSILDFNMYIPANAMLLSWICGTAASIGCDHASPKPANPAGGKLHLV